MARKCRKKGHLTVLFIFTQTIVCTSILKSRVHSLMQKEEEKKGDQVKSYLTFYHGCFCKK